MESEDSRLIQQMPNKIIRISKDNGSVRPEFCTDEMLEFLDELRESGETNMFGAAPYLEEEYPELAAGHSGFGSSPNAKAVLSYWMRSFSERRAEAANA